MQIGYSIDLSLFLFSLEKNTTLVVDDVTFGFYHIFKFNLISKKENLQHQYIYVTSIWATL